MRLLKSPSYIKLICVKNIDLPEHDYYYGLKINSCYSIIMTDSSGYFYVDFMVYFMLKKDTHEILVQETQILKIGFSEGNGTKGT